MSCFFSLIFIFLSTVNEKDSFWITLTYFTFFVPILCPSGYSSELDNSENKNTNCFVKHVDIFLFLYLRKANTSGLAFP